MTSPLTHVLHRIFARGFYRTHAGMFTFLLTSVVCYFFYIIPTHNLPPDVFIRENVRFTLSVLTTPAMTALMYGGWLLYTLKSWRYVSGQLACNSNLFIFYSIPAHLRRTQFKSWLAVQLWINIPLVAYALMALVVGFVYGHYTIAVITPFYILLLTIVSAGYYVWLSNTQATGYQAFSMLSAIRFRKPYFLLSLYYLLDREKLSFVITKLLSAAALTGMFYLFESDAYDPRVAALGVLLTATAHAWLILTMYRFEETHLSLGRNFPNKRTRLYAGQFALYLILLLPENVWLIVNFPFSQAITLVLFLAGTALLYYCILYRIGPHAQRYLQWVFTLFVLFFILLLSGLYPVLIPTTIVLSYGLFHHHYYNRKTTIRS